MIAVAGGRRNPDVARLAPSPATDALRAEVEAVGGSASLELDVRRAERGADVDLVGASLPSRPDADERRLIEAAADFWDIARGGRSEASGAIERRVRASSGFHPIDLKSSFVREMVIEEAISATRSNRPARRDPEPLSRPSEGPVADPGATRALHVAVASDPALARSMTGVDGIDPAALAAALQVTSRRNRRGSFDAEVSFTREASGLEQVRALFGDGPMPVLKGRIHGHQGPEGAVIEGLSTDLTRMGNGPDGPVPVDRVDSRSNLVDGTLVHSSRHRSQFDTTRDALFMEADRLFLGSVRHYDRNPPLEIVSSVSPSLEDLKARVASSERGVVLGEFSLEGSPSSGRLASVEDLRDAGRTYVGKDGRNHDIDEAIGPQMSYAAIRVPAIEHRATQERAIASFMGRMGDLGRDRPDDLSLMLGGDVGREAVDPSTLRVDSVRLVQGRARIAWSAGRDDDMVRGSALVRTSGEDSIATLNSTFKGMREAPEGHVPDGRVSMRMRLDGADLSSPEKSWVTRTDGYRLPVLSVEGSDLYLTDPMLDRAERITAVSPRLGTDLEGVKARVREQGGIALVRIMFSDLRGENGLEIASLDSVRRPSPAMIEMSDRLIRRKFATQAPSAGREGLVAQAKAASLDRPDDAVQTTRAKGRDEDEGFLARIGRMARSVTGRG